MKVPFEPIHSKELKHLSMKTASSMCIWNDGSRVSLHTNPAFFLKVITAFHINQSVELESFGGG
ncbi:UNVERIFIED_CONTAM: hypothetical protein FKN15_033412 [Acipenser sinensis]